MAEQVPYGLVVSIINRLASSAFKEIALIYGVNSEIERLKDTVEAIKAVVVDAEQKQRNDQLITIWIRRLKQVLLKADDLLVICKPNIAAQKSRKKKGTRLLYILKPNCLLPQSCSQDKKDKRAI